MTPQPSAVLPGLVWAPHPHPDGDYTWSAQWRGEVYESLEELAAALDIGVQSPAQRFEAWAAFKIGLDGFAPILNPDDWTDMLDRGPIDPETGASAGDPVPLEHRVSPHQGRDGLEGLLIHTQSGHVLRVLTGGFPPFFEIPVLVALNTPSHTIDTPDTLQL